MLGGQHVLTKVYKRGSDNGVTNGTNMCMLTCSETLLFTTRPKLLWFTIAVVVHHTAQFQYLRVCVQVDAIVVWSLMAALSTLRTQCTRTKCIKQTTDNQLFTFGDHGGVNA